MFRTTVWELEHKSGKMIMGMDLAVYILNMEALNSSAYFSINQEPLDPKHMAPLKTMYILS